VNSSPLLRASDFDFTETDEEPRFSLGGSSKDHSNLESGLSSMGHHDKDLNRLKHIIFIREADSPLGELSFPTSRSRIPTATQSVPVNNFDDQRSKI